MKVKNAVKTIASSFLVVIMCVCCLCFYGCNSVSETKSDLTTVISTTETTTVNADCSFEKFKSIEAKGEKINYYKNCVDKYGNDDMSKSEIADMKNTGSRWGGASTAGLFLENFVIQFILC